MASGARRDLRVHLGSIDNATAQRLLERYVACIHTHVVYFTAQLSQHFFVVTYEDLLVVAEVAVLEAYVRYRDDFPDREQVEGAGLGSYVDRVVRWRLADHVGAHWREGPGPQRMRRDAGNGALQDTPMYSETPEAAVYRCEAAAWLRDALGRLEPREAVIMISRAQGETNEAVGASLGLTRQIVHRIYHRTLVKLREQADEAGLDASELGIQT